MNVCCTVPHMCYTLMQGTVSILNVNVCSIVPEMSYMLMEDHCLHWMWMFAVKFYMLMEDQYLYMWMFAVKFYILMEDQYLYMRIFAYVDGRPEPILFHIDMWSFIFKGPPTTSRNNSPRPLRNDLIHVSPIQTVNYVESWEYQSARLVSQRAVCQADLACYRHLILSLWASLLHLNGQVDMIKPAIFTAKMTLVLLIRLGQFACYLDHLWCGILSADHATLMVQTSGPASVSGCWYSSISTGGRLYKAAQWP